MLLLLYPQGRLVGPVILIHTIHTRDFQEYIDSVRQKPFIRIIRFSCFKTSTLRSSLDLSVVPVSRLIIACVRKKRWDVPKSQTSVISSYFASLLPYSIMNWNRPHCLGPQSNRKKKSIECPPHRNWQMSRCPLCFLPSDSWTGSVLWIGRLQNGAEAVLWRCQSCRLSSWYSSAAPGWPVRRLLDTLLVRLATSLDH